MKALSWLVAIVGWLCSMPAYAGAPLVAAASDLRYALPEIATAFQEQTRQSVRLVFGSSGNFRQQIAHGAPFELFFSADEELALALAKDGHAIDEGALYAIGRIVVVVPVESSITADAELKDVAAALLDGRLTRFAIANPEHAPYGRRAKEVLIRAGLWDRMQNQLVLGENVSQAAQFALSGSTQGGIIAYSLALSPEISARASYALIPSDWHQPLRQRMVLLKNASDAARAFYRFVQTPSAQAILRRHGFSVPQETK